MSKSKPKNYGRRNQWDDDEYGDNYDYKGDVQRRKEKRMKNLIRSKNIDQIMDMDDDEYDGHRRSR